MTIQQRPPESPADSVKIIQRINALQALMEKKLARLGITSAASPGVTPTTGATPITQLLYNTDGNHSNDTWFNDPSVPGDEQDECAHIYTHPPDTAQQVLDGAMGVGLDEVTSVTGGFTSQDETDGVEIVIEGAGAAGVDLVTNVTNFTNSNTVTVGDAAVVGVTGARVRWRLQELKEDSTHDDVDTDPATNSALKAPGHSKYATTINDPEWDSAAGVARLGTTNTIDFPIPGSRQLQPGRTVFAICKLARRSVDALAIGARIGMGIWDNSAGRRMFIEGGRFTLTAILRGSPVATTTGTYKIIAKTDRGYTFESNEVTLTVPTDASYITNQVFTELDWDSLTGNGVLSFVVQRLKDGVYHDLYTIPNGVPGYSDDGRFERIISGFTTATALGPRAFTNTRTGSLDDLAVDGVDPEWDFLSLGITIPSTYNMGLTTGKQWLRVMLSQALTGTDAAHGLLMDVFGLSLTDGIWAPHAADSTTAQVSAIDPNGSNQGTIGGPGGGGGIGCVVFDMPIRMHDFTEKPYKTVGIGDYVWSANFKPNLVDDNSRRVTTDVLYTVRTANGCGRRGYSPTHRIITSAFDDIGTPVEHLVMGEKIVTAPLSLGGLIEWSEIVELTPKVVDAEPVGTLRVSPGFMYFAAGLGSHNSKPVLPQD